MAGEQNILSSWKTHTENKKLKFFDENSEKKWDGPFFFIQGADIQFGLISRYIEKNPVVDWEKEKVLAEEIVEQVNKMNPKPRFFVICGDLCDATYQDEPAMRQEQELDFKRIFGKVDKDIPVVCVCGNHDVGDTPTNETVKSYRSSFGDDFFSFWCGGILFLVINSQYLYDPTQVPDVADEHSKWIENQLEEAKKIANTRIVIFQHIPWFLNSADEEEVFYFTLKSEIRKKWLDKFKDSGVEAIFCGHYHRNAGGKYRGIDVVTTSAIGGQLGNDQSGARIVKVLQDKIDHEYYAIKDLPLKTEFSD